MTSMNEKEKEPDQIIKETKKLLEFYEKQHVNSQEKELKKKSIGFILKSTLEMIKEDKEQFIDKIVDSVNSYVETSQLENSIMEQSIGDLNSKVNIEKKRKEMFIENVHIHRQSVLSVLFDSDINMKTLYYIILCIFFWLCMWVAADNYEHIGNIFDKPFWANNLRNWDKTVTMWFAMFFSSFFIVFYVQLINAVTLRFQKVFYIPFIAIYSVFQVTFLLVFVIIGLQYNKSFVLGVTHSCEMVRFIMKNHAYFRDKILYGLKEYNMKYVNFTDQADFDVDTACLPEIKIYSLFKEFQLYLYFLFCPSVIYRDKYPKTSVCRYDLAFAHFFNFVLCVIFFYILVRFICIPYFNSTKVEDYYDIYCFIFDFLRFAIPATSFLIVGFFMFLHSWLNFWAEIMQHGDRRFYQEWWNSTNFEEYYRKWNMVVHEWLYYYVFNDVIRLSRKRLNKTIAKGIVFLISVILHELILWLAMGFFFPVLTIFFGGLGFLFSFVKPSDKRFNVIFWLKLFLGSSMLCVLYLREYNMRMSVFNSIDLVEWWHTFVPRTILMHLSQYKTIIQEMNKNISK